MAQGKAAPKRKLSTLKRVRQDRKKNLANRSVKSEVKTYARKVDEAIGAKDQAKVDETVRSAASVIGKAASKGVLHKNTAARKISRLAKKANSALKTA